MARSRHTAARPRGRAGASAPTRLAAAVSGPPTCRRPGRRRSAECGRDPCPAERLAGHLAERLTCLLPCLPPAARLAASVVPGASPFACLHTIPPSLLIASMILLNVTKD